MKDLPAKLYADGYTICDSNGRVLAESRSMRLVTVLVELYNERQELVEKAKRAGGELE